MDDGKTIFEGLYNIDWSSLQHVNDDSAAGVPNALLDLLSNEESTRTWARRILFDEHKADWGVYTEAYRYIVPFVCDLLAFDAVKDRYHLFYNLSIILSCSCDFTSTDRVKDYVFIYSTIEKYISLILTLLHHEDECVRWGTLELLKLMDGNIETVIPELVARFEIETEEHVRINILKALEKLFSQNIPRSLSLRETYAPFFRAIVEGNLSSDIRYQGALAGLMAAKNMIGSQSIKESEISPQTAPIMLERFWHTYRTYYHNTEAHLLKIMLLPKASSLLWDMLHDSRLHVEDQQIVLRALFRVRFQARWLWHYPKIGPHFDAQREKTGPIYNDIGVKQNDLKGNTFLKDIVNDDSLWHDRPTNIFSYFLGLPDNRNELRAFLEGNTE